MIKLSNSQNLPTLRLRLQPTDLPTLPLKLTFNIPTFNLQPTNLQPTNLQPTNLQPSTN
ncbi:MAG: hypothetical protein F6K50_49455 [Moorea sp. SIO3I7]|uniref:hypothetical protein n=1 Tax=unclassified Moorena TaxID=2683338 RepID=UPI0013C74600|nr:MULTISPECIES: hypothetical protein [unclassified Moorena]NEO03066.1 hypothetical protein [Moorena sp. SIO3I7]NEO16518.1 hypothetical protein [Moorena sp. SIO3E8]NEP28733.1 hypothetical protein [Moorena sp. SIO3I6]NEQ03030.1 hypothetical protein [Moorena sp. SIO3F7]